MSGTTKFIAAEQIEVGEYVVVNSDGLIQKALPAEWGNAFLANQSYNKGSGFGLAMIKPEGESLTK